MNRYVPLLTLLIACGGEDLDAATDASPPTEHDGSSPTDVAPPRDVTTERCTPPLVWGECADGTSQCRYEKGLVVQQRSSTGDDYKVVDVGCDFTADGSMSFTARKDLVIRFQSVDGLWVIRLIDFAARAAAPSTCDLYVDCVLSARDTIEAYLFEFEGGPIKYAHDPGMIPGGTVRPTFASTEAGSFVSLRLFIQLDDYITGSGRVTKDMIIEGNTD